MPKQLIGLCGSPKSGKSEIQKIMHRNYQIIPIDDGEVLREFAINYLGLSVEDVYTQEGKARATEILGKTWINRDLLGSLGNSLEQLLGDQVMPFIACQGLHSERSYSFGSVRKNQGEFYKSLGGVIIEVTRPGVAPSPYDFDRYDRSVIDVVIENDGSLADLELAVGEALDMLQVI